MLVIRNLIVNNFCWALASTDSWKAMPKGRWRLASLYHTYLWLAGWNGSSCDGLINYHIVGRTGCVRMCMLQLIRPVHKIFYLCKTINFASTRRLNKSLTNNLILKLTLLWTTGPRCRYLLQTCQGKGFFKTCVFHKISKLSYILLSNNI